LAEEEEVDDELEWEMEWPLMTRAGLEEPDCGWEESWAPADCCRWWWC